MDGFDKTRQHSTPTLDYGVTKSVVVEINYCTVSRLYNKVFPPSEAIGRGVTHARRKFDERFGAAENKLRKAHQPLKS